MVLLETGCVQAVSFLASFRVENPFFWRDLPITILETLSNFGFRPRPSLLHTPSLGQPLSHHSCCDTKPVGHCLLSPTSFNKAHGLGQDLDRGMADIRG